MVLELIQTSLNKDFFIDKEVLKDVDWEEVKNIASAHGLSAIAFDGQEKALDSHPEWRNEVPNPLLIPWYGQCVQQTALFKKNWSAACSLALLLGDRH